MFVVSMPLWTGGGGFPVTMSRRESLGLQLGLQLLLDVGIVREVRDDVVHAETHELGQRNAHGVNGFERLPKRLSKLLHDPRTPLLLVLEDRTTVRVGQHGEILPLG